MNDRDFIFSRKVRARRLAPLYAAVSLCLVSIPSIASASATAQLPDTPVGHLAAELIHHANNDSPQQMRQWLPGVLSASIESDDRAAFVTDMTSTARDSRGIDVFDVRTDPHQPGMLEVAVKGRRNGQAALFWLTADAAHPDRLAQAMLVEMDNPLFDDWPKQSVSHAELRKRIDTTLDRLVRTSDFSGCVTVLDGGNTVFDECRGLAERSFNVPIDHQTKFHVGSIDKMFTAVAIAQLVEAGKLSWTDTLAQRVPEYPDQTTAKRITVWQLLHHTSGLGDFLVPKYFEHSERFVDPVDYLGLIARQPVVSDPAQPMPYSNAGFILLGRIIENVSGESYFDYIQQHIFDPAKMTSSGFDSVDDIVPGLAVGYYHNDGVFSRTWKADWLKIGYKSGPAGGGYSTNADLLRFATALQTGILVKPATLKKMFEDEVPAGPGSYATGFGDRISHGLHIRGHQGGIEGTTANLEMVWGTGAAVALTSNEGQSQHWLLAEEIADLLAAESKKN